MRENVCVELNIVKRYQTQLILEGVLEIFFIDGQLRWDNLTLGIHDMINLKIRALLLYVLEILSACQLEYILHLAPVFHLKNRQTITVSIYQRVVLGLLYALAIEKVI